MRPAGEKPFIIKNEYRSGGRQVHWYEGKNSSALVAEFHAQLMLGKKLMMVSDSKRFIKKLERALNDGTNLRSDLRSLLEEMGNAIIPMGDGADVGAAR
ncbi:hypothetical protein [Nostoc sp. MG11]|uniref:hypothetical protein n=1 Tax=Nostoc sp. MG11 TaxID=2721166 RepID=UPI001D01924B|nr:hypothetical protein [Nostoc sp. MG11]